MAKSCGDQKILSLLPLFFLLIVAGIFVSRSAEHRTKTSDEVLLSLTDVYREHYHSTEQHNGHLYVIRRTSGDNWTDALWRYDGTDNGKMFYTERGLDFRVSDDEHYVAIFNAEGVSILNLTSNETRTVSMADLGLNDAFSLYPFAWSSNQLWFASNQGIQLTRIFSVDAAKAQVGFAVSVNQLSMTIGETALNPSAGLVAFSDYQEPFTDADVNPSAPPTVLKLYNMDTQAVTTVVTSATTQAMRPTWEGSATLEYNGSVSRQRDTYTIK